MTFEDYLRKENLSDHTISVYLWTVEYYNNNYDDLTKENLLAYKGYLIEYFKPKTVNLRIQAINKYLEYRGLEKLRLSAVKIQQKSLVRGNYYQSLLPSMTAMKPGIFSSMLR